jgi:hypothetical protein
MNRWAVVSRCPVNKIGKIRPMFRDFCTVKTKKAGVEPAFSEF